MQPQFLCEISDYSIADYLQRQNTTSGSCGTLTGVHWHTFKNLEWLMEWVLMEWKTSIPSTLHTAIQLFFPKATQQQGI